MSGQLSMKPLLSIAIHEAVKLALIDSVGRKFPNGEWDDILPEEREAWRRDIYSLPSGLMESIDPIALAQNVCCRLLGVGGWEIPMPDGEVMYAPNMTPQEVMHFSLPRRPEPEPNTP